MTLLHNYKKIAFILALLLIFSMTAMPFCTLFFDGIASAEGLVQLTTPTGITLNLDGTISFDAVSNANGYEIRLLKSFYGFYDVIDLITIDSPSFLFKPWAVRNGEGVYTISVVALGDDVNYIDSDTAEWESSFSYVKPSLPVVSGGVLEGAPSQDYLDMLFDGYAVLEGTTVRLTSSVIVKNPFAVIYNNLSVNLNGYTIYGADGTSSLADGAPAMILYSASQVSLSGGGGIRGGDGYGNGSGGDGITILEIIDLIGDTTVTIGSNVSIRGGNGSGTDDGGKGVSGAAAIVNNGAVRGGDGGTVFTENGGFAGNGGNAFYNIVSLSGSGDIRGGDGGDIYMKGVAGKGGKAFGGSYAGSGGTDGADGEIILIRYTVTFVIDGKTISEQSVVKGSSATTPSITLPTDGKNDYSFGGWDKQFDAITEDTVVTGSFIATPKIFTVDFVADGIVISSQKIAYGGNAILPEIPQKASDDSFDYQFERWIGDTENVTGDRTITAGFTQTPKKQPEKQDDDESGVEEERYIIVSFQYNHPEVNDLVRFASFGSLISRPTAPSVSDKSFEGWYKDAQLSKEWNFAEDKVEKTTVLYAKWSNKAFTVNFESNGGTMVMPITNVYYNNKISEPTQPENNSLLFAGWYYDSAFSKKFDFYTDTILDNVTLFARWEDAFGAVSGAVTQDGTPVDNAKIQIKKGSSIIATTYTDAGGKYALFDIPADTYNIVASIWTEKGDLVQTISANVGKEQTVYDFEFEKNSVSVGVELGANTPDVVIDGLAEFLTNELGSALTQEDLDILANGGSVDVKVFVDNLIASDNAKLKELLEQAKKDGIDVYSLFDVTILKITYDGNIIKTSYVVGLQKMLTVIIPMPEEMRGKDDIIVYRLHGDSKEAITAEPNEFGEYLEISDDGNSIIVHTKRFSSYAVGAKSDTIMDKVNARYFWIILDAVLAIALGVEIWLLRDKKDNSVKTNAVGISAVGASAVLLPTLGPIIAVALCLALVAIPWYYKNKK